MHLYLTEEQLIETTLLLHYNLEQHLILICTSHQDRTVHLYFPEEQQLSVLYTQGQYDFVETIEAPGPESVLGFTIWYSKKGFGNIQTLPAFGDQEIRKIIRKG